MKENVPRALVNLTFNDNWNRRKTCFGSLYLNLMT